jgi:hypothetical protein
MGVWVQTGLLFLKMEFGSGQYTWVVVVVVVCVCVCVCVGRGCRRDSINF